VDYWDGLGWKDPYSSPLFSERQRAYAKRLGLDGVYTPQMIVDGRYQFVGSDLGAARSAIASALKAAKADVQISSATRDSAGVSVSVDLGGPVLMRHSGAQLILGLADDPQSTKVIRGENSGRSLTHVAVVRSLTKVGTAGSLRGNAKVTVPFGSFEPRGQVRVVALLQDGASGPILGAAIKRL
jgi:hypothetical protein